MLTIVFKNYISVLNDISIVDGCRGIIILLGEFGCEKIFLLFIEVQVVEIRQIMLNNNNCQRIANVNSMKKIQKKRHIT